MQHLLVGIEAFVNKPNHKCTVKEELFRRHGLKNWQEATKVTSERIRGCQRGDLP